LYSALGNDRQRIPNLGDQRYRVGGTRADNLFGVPCSRADRLPVVYQATVGHRVGDHWRIPNLGRRRPLRDSCNGAVTLPDHVDHASALIDVLTGECRVLLHCILDRRDVQVVVSELVELAKFNIIPVSSSPLPLRLSQIVETESILKSASQMMLSGPLPLHLSSKQVVIEL